MKIGIFHWNYEYIGGGEQLAYDIGRALNEKIYSIVTARENKFGFIDISSHLSPVVKTLRKIRTLDYLTWSSVDVTEYGDFDMILSTAPAGRALIVPDDVPHVNLCFSPPRWLYDLYHIRKGKMGILKDMVQPFAEMMRIWDASVDNRVDYYVSISPVIKRRLWKYLKRDSDIIYPSIDVLKYDHLLDEGYFLFLSRLEIEKRPEETIKACIIADQRLIVAGTGTLEKKLRQKYRAYKNIEFIGFISDDTKINLLSRCRALIYPAIAEDFGIVPVEALASGKPVICADGFPEMLVGDKYGVVTDGSIEGIVKGIRDVEKMEFNPEDLRKCAMQFDYSIFKEKINERMKFYKDDFDGKFNI